MPVPTLALVDAFVGGLAILLILIVLSSRTEPRSGERPAPDLALVCAEDRIRLAPVQPGQAAGAAIAESWPSGGLEPEVAVARIAALDPSTVGDRLSVRVRLATDVGGIACAGRLERAVQEMNDRTDAARRPEEAGLHLLLSLHVLHGDEEV